MIIHDMPQGGAEWRIAHLGIPTASQFHRIITAVKGDLSKQANKYAYELVAETLLGRPLEGSTFDTPAMERGRRLEPIADQYYQFTTDTETRLVGFVTTDDGRLGCSPDRLIVGQSGGLEIKCKLDSAHLAILLDGPEDDHRQQVQGTMAICEAAWWDLLAYHPDLPSSLTRIERDEPYIAKMSAAFGQFLDMRDEMLVRARASGFFAEQNYIAEQLAIKEAA